MSRFSSLLLSCIIVFLALPAAAGSSSHWISDYDFTKRAAAREQGRWSLSDWLAIKDRNRQMDMWLSMNSPSPFEFMLGASYLSYQTDLHDGTDKTSHISYSGEIAGWAQLVGLSAEYEHNAADHFTDLTGLLNLRVFGNSVQNSALILSYGLRTREMTEPVETKLAQQFGQAELLLYIFKYFGVNGKYRYFLPTSNDDLGDVKGDYTEAGAFIDFKALRIFGAWYKENQKNQTPAATSETLTERSGVRSGIKIFF